MEQVDVVTNLELFSEGDLGRKYKHFVKKLSGINSLLFSNDFLKIISPIALAENSTPFFIIVSRNDAIIGLAPLILESYGINRFFFRRLNLWGKGTSYFEYPTPRIIAIDGNEELVVKFVLNYLKENLRGQFDEIFLNRVDMNDLFTQSLCDTFKPSFTNPNLDRQLFFLSHQTIDEKLKGENLRRTKRAVVRLEEAYENVKYQCHFELSQRLVNEIVNLHIQRQNEVNVSGGSRYSFFEDPIELQATKDILDYSQKNNCLRVYTLHVNDELICFWIGLHNDGYTLGYITAFKPLDGHPHAPSSLLRFAFKEELERFGAKIIDSNYGANILKKKFSNHFLDLGQVLLFNQFSFAPNAFHSIRGFAKKVKNAIK